MKARTEQEAKAESGRIWLEGGSIHYKSKVYGEWQLPVDSLRLAGEYTNQNGPFFDDYFLVFASDAKGWFEASFHADGRDIFLRELGERLESKLKLGLHNSADFNSRILWPRDLAGKPLFEFYPTPPTSLWGRLLKWVGLGTISRRFTSESLSALNAKS